MNQCLFLLSFVSCASTTTIRATSINEEVDKKVKIYVDDVYLGSGEAQYSDKKPKNPFRTIIDPVVVKLKKPGCAVLKENLKVIQDKQNTSKAQWFLGISTLMLLVSPILAAAFMEDFSTGITIVGVGTAAGI